MSDLKTFIHLGTSGCGKSTTIQLIERFYDANFGRLVSNLFRFISSLTHALLFYS
jgi:ABC-type transport system involved in cytochrome bd biosynthesis fused ATPase/permease subunit